ncbi:MAG: hypothetical protein ACTH0V_18125 [Microbacteriaceae bacterium]
MSIGSYVVEAASGVRVLPTRGGDPLAVNEWVAHLACDADLRRRVPEYAQIAQMLIVTPVPQHEFSDAICVRCGYGLTAQMLLDQDFTCPPSRPRS